MAVVYPPELDVVGLVNYWDSLSDEQLSYVDEIGGGTLAFLAAQRKPDEDAVTLLEYLCLGRRVCNAGTTDNNNQTAAFFAARDGNVKAVAYLAQQGCDITAVDSAGQSCLFYASREGQDEMVEMLINQFHVPINHVDRVGQSALFYAAREGRKSTVEIMLRAGADPKQRDWQKKCAHSYAQKRGHNELAAMLKAACAMEGINENNLSANKNHQKKGVDESSLRHKCQLQRAIEIGGETVWLFATQEEMESFEALHSGMSAWNRTPSNTFKPIDGFRMEWSMACLECVYLVSSYDEGWLFSKPVDTKAWNCPDYYKVITEPRDLGLIKRNLRNMTYESIEDFFADMDLLFNNCFRYNPPDTHVHQAGRRLKEFWEKLIIEKKLDRYTQLEPSVFASCGTT